MGKTLQNWTLTDKTAEQTRRMAIVNGKCVSFCNQPKAQFGYFRRVTPVCRCLNPFFGWRHLATVRESKAHFGLSWVRPCMDNRGKCHIDKKRIQCLSNASQHVPIYLQLFPSNSSRKFKSSPLLVHFCTFWPPLAGYAPATIAVITWMERGFNACKTPRCIYPSSTISEI